MRLGCDLERGSSRVLAALGRDTGPLLNKRFGLTPLPGLAARDTHGEAAMDDVTNALQFP
jgi:hypothetical protein